MNLMNLLITDKDFKEIEYRFENKDEFLEGTHAEEALRVVPFLIAKINALNESAGWWGRMTAKCCIAKRKLKKESEARLKIIHQLEEKLIK